MMARALFFVLGVLVGAGALFFYVATNHNISIFTTAPSTAPVTQAPRGGTPQIATQQPVRVSPTTVLAPRGEASPIAPPDLAAVNLLLPVMGIQPGELVDTFNQARGTRAHQAIDIMAPRGREIVAVADGKIVKLFNSKQGGLTLYQFDNAERLAYYYAHLDGYAPGIVEGKILKRGELVGYVGSSGNANPDGPHLHFAIFELGPEKKWWEGKPINPYPLLTRTSK